MKLKTLLAAALIATIATSCGSEAKTEEHKADATAETPAAEAPATGAASVEKNWVLDNIDASAAMVGMPKDQQEKMKGMMDAMVASQKGKMALDMQAGGKVVANSPDLSGNWKTTEGKWSLSEDKKTLTLDMDGKKDEFTVAELTADKLNLEMKGEKMNMIFTAKK
jgi:PBP1b-binding outer membrane lipoprotein LpoB